MQRIVVLGIGAAVAGPNVDMVLSRINDTFLSLPTIMLGLVVVAAVGSSIPILIVAAGLIYASVVYRLARAIAGQSTRVPLVVSGDLHAIGMGRMHRAGTLDLNANPITAVYAQAVDTAPPGGMPMAIEATVHIRNDHLQYALTWFALAVILAVIYVLYHLRPASKGR